MTDFPSWFAPLLENKARASISYQTGSVSGALLDITAALKAAANGNLVCEMCKAPLPTPGHVPTCPIDRAYREIFQTGLHFAKNAPNEQPVVRTAPPVPPVPSPDCKLNLPIPLPRPKR
ncbi:MAG TPA: hypothetical protein V6C97_09595 [Oculatellaceae cyanobacterium]